MEVETDLKIVTKNSDFSLRIILIMGAIFNDISFTCLVQFEL